MLSKFFGVSCKEGKDIPHDNSVTILQVPERGADGSISVVTKVLETLVDPLSTLKFSDFSINNMLAAGVSPRAIHISNDIRIGSDKDIKAFNDRVDMLADKMFNDKK